MKTTLIPVMVITLLMGLTSCGPGRDDSKKEAEDENEQKFKDSDAKNDTEFAVAAADASMLESRLGELAQSNSSSEEVKSFGQMMIRDHKMAADELKALALQKNITLPEVMGNKCQSKYDDLVKKTGKDFDDAYTDLMVKDHKDAINMFRKQAEKGNDPDLRSWASGKIALLDHHLEAAQQAEEVVDKMK